MMNYLSRFAAVVALLVATETAKAAPDASPWERSVVTIEVTRKQYDYFQPWSKRMESVQKNGVVVGPRQILTTAEHMNDTALLRVQKGGHGTWWNGQVQWIDYHANLALVTATDAKLWDGLEAVTLADPIPAKGSAQLARWRNGQLETHKAELNRLIVKHAKLSFIDHVQLELDSEISGAGWAEPVISGRKLFGLVCSQDGINCTAIPAPFIKSILDAQKKGPYRGLGYFDFVWTRAENPNTLKFLKLEGEPRGVIILDTPSLATNSAPLRPRDLILQIDGFEIDVEGNYKDPAYGNLLLENLSTRNRWAGDSVRLKILRDGKPLDVNYTLPKAKYTDELVPEEIFDREPEYLVAGGLVFQPLTEPYLRSWGGDWRRKAPFRLSYYTQDKPTARRPSRILLSLVLPDPYNLGYQDYRFLVVDQVNGQPVSKLSDVQSALAKPSGGYDVIQFARGEAVRRMVLDAEGIEDATHRVMQRYGIDRDLVVDPAAAR